VRAFKDREGAKRPQDVWFGATDERERGASERERQRCTRTVKSRERGAEVLVGKEGRKKSRVRVDTEPACSTARFLSPTVTDADADE
jgi:hypothetical protein